VSQEELESVRENSMRWQIGNPLAEEENAKDQAKLKNGKENQDSAEDKKINYFFQIFG